jgi:hypothetical protein
MTPEANSRLGAGLFTVLLIAIAGCVSTSLDLPRDHPANPRASTPPLLLSNPLQAGSAVPAPGHDAATHATHDRAETQQSKPESGEVWTCPMHPEVVRGGPGKCPICGMNLVKRAKAPEPQGGN